MSSKKNSKKSKQKKKLKNPVANKSTKKAKKPSLAAKIFQRRVLSTFAFAVAGLMAGLFTGLNHFPEPGGMSVVPSMLMLAAYLGDPHLDTALGSVTALTGLGIGACLGFSTLSDPKDLGMSLLFSTVASVFVFSSTGNVGLTGLAFVAGHTPAFLGYLRLKRA